MAPAKIAVQPDTVGDLGEGASLSDGGNVDIGDHLNMTSARSVDLVHHRPAILGECPKSSNNEVVAGMIVAMICRVLVITVAAPGNPRVPARKSRGRCWTAENASLADWRAGRSTESGAVNGEKNPLGKETHGCLGSRKQHRLML
jgi:hypothetical protein